VYKKGCSIRYGINPVHDKVDPNMLKMGKECRRHLFGLDFDAHFSSTEWIAH